MIKDLMLEEIGKQLETGTGLTLNDLLSSELEAIITGNGSSELKAKLLQVKWPGCKRKKTAEEIESLFSPDIDRGASLERLEKIKEQIEPKVR